MLEHNVELLIQNISTSLAKSINPEEALMVGIQTGGVWVAQKLHQQLKLKHSLGKLNIRFYRDDFTTQGLHPNVLPSELPSIDNKHIILVDDVLMSGRTIRAAMNELFDFGRPASITLVTLYDLNHRQLPIHPDIVGQTIDLPKQQRIKLRGPEPLSIELLTLAEDI